MFDIYDQFIVPFLLAKSMPILVHVVGVCYVQFVLKELDEIHEVYFNYSYESLFSPLNTTILSKCI